MITVISNNVISNKGEVRACPTIPFGFVKGGSVILQQLIGHVGTGEVEISQSWLFVRVQQRPRPLSSIRRCPLCSEGAQLVQGRRRSRQPMPRRNLPGGHVGSTVK